MWITATDSLALPGNTAGGSMLWRGCHWYWLCNFLLAGVWWLWLNLGFSLCHPHYCAGIPRVPALRILCHILSCQLWALPAGPVAWHNTDYASPTRGPAFAILSPALWHTLHHAFSLFSPLLSSSFPCSITNRLKPLAVTQQARFIYFSLLQQSVHHALMISLVLGSHRRVTPGLWCYSRGH